MDTAAGAPSEFTRVRRLPERAAYDAGTVHAVLDAAMIGHVGVVREGRPVVIPMLFGRVGDDLYLHGSVASQLLRALGAGVPACFTATVIDGLVYARSAFHHSMNYRSVVVVGTASTVHGDEKMCGLRAVVDHITPGRWDEARPPNELELRKTALLRMPIDEASAKIRVGGPADEPEDLALPVWAGHVPVTPRFAPPVDAADLRPGVDRSSAVARLVDGPGDRAAAT
ncbi:MAG TPA: pyridoxamine 5'-phosphate oxidase family protein [Acidimicrobiales bacterium]|nr:pyridoxamine 5'-phosphate oxidase family protein [Acidimicrobiales bacterium]